MIIAAIIIGLSIAASFFAIARCAVAKKADEDLDEYMALENSDAEDHSASSELRCVTKINDHDILKGYWV